MRFPLLLRGSRAGGSRALGAYLGVLMVRRAVGVAIMIPVGRHLGATDFGAIAIGTSVGAALSVVLGFGIDMLIFRAAARSEEGRVAAGSFVALVCSPALGFAMIAVLFAVGDVPGSALTLGDWILVIAAASLVRSLNSFTLPVLRARQRLRPFVWLNLLIALVLVLSKLWFILVLGWGVTGWFMSDLMVGVLAYSWAWALYVRPSTFEVVGLVKQGLPLIPHQGSQWAISQSDRLVLGRVAGVEQTGMYAAAGLISGLVGQVVAEVSNATAPAYARLGKGIDATSLVLAQMRTVLTLALPFSVVGPWLLAIAYPGPLSGARAAIPALVLGQVLFGVYLAAANALTLSAGITHVLWRATGIAAFANVALTVAMATSWGLWGAVVATVVTYAIMASGAVWLLSTSDTTVRWRCLGEDRTIVLCGLAVAVCTVAWPLLQSLVY